LNTWIKYVVTPGAAVMWFTQYKDLIWYLTITDLKIKYQNSLLGFAWSLISPLLMMVVLYAVFVNVFRYNQDNFALYILTGLFAWRFLAIGTSSALSSIVSRPGLVTKIKIPRQILVLSNTLSCFISSLLEFCVLIPLIIILGVKITPYMLFFPVIHGIYFFVVYGLSLALASLFVFYRDLNQIWEVVLQIGFFLSPIVYPISIIPVTALPYYILNPVTVLIETYRNVLLNGTAPSPIGVLYVALIAVVLMSLGITVFKRLERRFAEEI
jgi:lipopolysaccharide transport system permease protein